MLVEDVLRLCDQPHSGEQDWGLQTELAETPPHTQVRAQVIQCGPEG